MNPLKLLLPAAIIMMSVFLSCNTSSKTPLPDPTPVVDSEAIIKDRYLNDKTELFILYNGTEHKADSALFVVQDIPGEPKMDHFVVYFHHPHDFFSYGCIRILVENLDKNIGSPHRIWEYSQECSSLYRILINYGGDLTLTQVSDSFVSGNFECSGRFGSFNNVPVLR